MHPNETKQDKTTPPNSILQHNLINTPNLIDLINGDFLNTSDTGLKQSLYYNNLEFIKQQQNNNIFTIITLNCQSLNSKFSQLQIYIENFIKSGCMPDIICLQETWLSNEADTSLLQLENYILLSKGKSCSAHGGIAMYINKNLRYKEVNISNFTANWDGQFVEFEIENCSIVNQKKLILCNIYRPPKNDIVEIQNFTQDLSKIFDHFDKEKNVLIAGDFNIDLLKLNSNNHINEYYDCIIASGYIPSLTLPTRLGNSSGTLIDNILVKLSNACEYYSGNIISNISDHLPCFLSLKKESNHTVKNYIRIHPPFNESINGLKQDLSNISEKLNSLTYSTEVNENYNEFSNTIQSLIEKHFYTKLVKFNKHKHRKEKWMTKGILKSIIKRDKLYLKHKQTPEYSAKFSAQKEKLRFYNKILKQCIRQAKRNFYESIFKKYKNDPKNTWLNINQILNKHQNKRKLPTSFRINDKIINDETIISNEFNRFYSEIGPKLAKNIKIHKNKSFMDYLPKSRNLTFKFKPVNSGDVIKTINTLKSTNSKGLDNISNKLLKHIKEEISEPISNLINQSFKTGIFPDGLKIAKIIPIYKKNDEALFENYRPISLLPSFSKIFEKIMHNQIANYFEKNDLFYKSQYGFREKHNTEHATIEMIDQITRKLEKNETPINIYLDMSKAFDTLDHDILITKLKHYGFKYEALDLCKSYFTNRVQCVEFNNNISTPLPIHTGVPQGSILGPLFFIIYTNDFVHSSELFHPIVFADDTTLLTTLRTPINNTHDISKTINDGLINVNTWLEINKLSLNCEKTKSMIFRTPQKKILNPTIKIGSHIIEFVDQFNFLGFVLQFNLKWKYHANNVSKKLNKILGIMNKLKHVLPTEAMMHIYNSLFLPHVNYGLFLWGWESKFISKSLKRAVRIISKSPYNAHTQMLFKNLKILNFESLCALHDYKICYKIEQNQFPKYHISVINQIREMGQSRYATRSNELQYYKLIFCKYEFSKQSFSYRIPRVMNQMPKNIKDKIYTHSFIGYKLYIKNFLLNRYETNCTIPNCYVCTKL